MCFGFGWFCIFQNVRLFFAVEYEIWTNDSKKQFQITSKLCSHNNYMYFRQFIPKLLK